MELRHLRYFLAVAETLNFSRAAERLRVAQPALSKQIRDLEAELGAPLFFRTTARVELTALGEHLKPQAERVLTQVDLLVTGAQQLAKGSAGVLRIGSDWALSSHPITAAAKRLRDANPHISVDFVEIPSHQHATAIASHTIDVGFGSSNFLHNLRDLDVRHIYTMSLQVVLPRTHRLAGKKSVALRELRNEPWLELDRSVMPGFRDLMKHFTAHAGFTPKYHRAARSLPGMLANVSAGYGVALLPSSFEAGDTSGVIFIDTDCPQIDVMVMWSKTAASPVVPQYLALLEKEILSTYSAKRLPVSLPGRARSS